MTWNHLPYIFLWYTLLLLTHCLRDIHGGGIASIAVLRYHRIIMRFSPKNGWITQNLSYIDIFLHCLLLKRLIIVFLPSTYRSMKEADIPLLAYGYLLRYLGLWLLMSTCSALYERGAFLGVSSHLIKRKIHAPIALGD